MGQLVAYGQCDKSWQVVASDQQAHDWSASGQKKSGLLGLRTEFGRRVPSSNPSSAGDVQCVDRCTPLAHALPQVGYPIG